MSKPKVLEALHDLDERGFYDRSNYLGDIRTSPTCLDTTLENGIYAFTGGESSPTDTTGSHKWSLRVYSCEDCTSSLHLAEKINFDTSRTLYVRNFGSGIWSDWISGSSGSSYTVLTQAEYDALEVYDENTLYIISDDVDEYSRMELHMQNKAIHVTAEEKEKWNNVDFSAVEQKIADLESKVDNQAPAYTYGTEDLEAGVSPLEAGKLYFVYE